MLHEGKRAEVSAVASCASWGWPSRGFCRRFEVRRSRSCARGPSPPAGPVQTRTAPSPTLAALLHPAPAPVRSACALELASSSAGAVEIGESEDARGKWKRRRVDGAGEHHD